MKAVVTVAATTVEVTGIPPDEIPFREILDDQRPTIFKGLARDWPMVQAGLASPGQAIEYLQSFDGGRPIVAYTGQPEIKGRYFYNDELTALNFESGRTHLPDYLARMRNHLEDPHPPSFYIGSTDVDIYFPGFRRENDLALADPMFEHATPTVSLWIGNRTVASAHYDMSNNIACCLVGRRRFTLFPPDQIANLYPGPLEPTPGGQVVSLVNFEAPDFEAHPRFHDALAAGQVAELDPGDVLVYPALWWHHVEALEPFNVLMNYWWNDVPAFMDSPMNTLLHGLLSLRDRPEAEKAAWKQVFEYYVFGPAAQAGAHLPDHARGPLGPLDEQKARRLRAYLLNRLNR